MGKRVVQGYVECPWGTARGDTRDEGSKKSQGMSPPMHGMECGGR